MEIQLDCKIRNKETKRLNQIVSVSITDDDIINLAIEKAKELCFVEYSEVVEAEIIRTII